ncbi:PQQ-like beta-propeller repeat protein [Stieleria sp. JC731]|uniref:outer membrane protein assembly factor BamB family protein n=1 Tax=Pirellulaceae TaxID=2691357 RepID=UPI001E5CDA0A|nr:PQQ-binding-like beta-propeller repeat protein [Stieleria sp. JC731]MCC9601094.1 PQQ-like beta-propeller repeat protein [Stieleria sp. JC731]
MIVSPTYQYLPAMRIAFTIVFVLTVLLSSLKMAPAFADDWPGFRGLSKGGVVADATLPQSFLSQQPKWVLELGTRDVGSMAIQDGRVFLVAMAPQSPTLRLLAVDLQSGKEVWSRDYPQIDNHLHNRNTLASSTPATDSDFVYFANSDREHTWLRCLDHDGNLQWARDFGPAQSQHGFAASPTVVNDIVLLNFSQQKDQVRSGTPGTSKVIAIDRKTGETKWSTPVTSTRVCYGVPSVVEGKVICANTGDGVFALSLETGELLWRLPVFSMRCVSSPIVVGDLAIGSSGSGGGGNHLVAVRMPSATNESPEEAYRVEKFAPYVPTAVTMNGLLFMFDDKGIASCVDATDGSSKWTKRLGGNVSASPILIGDKVVMINMEGEATVVNSSDEFEKVGSVDLGGPVSATPAFANGNLLVRVGTQLRCYE